MSEPIRILVLEDDVSLRQVLEQVLKSRGYEVVVSSRGEEAVHHARGEKFDLIIADIRMEGMNGLDTIERTQEIQPGIGSIVVSGFASEEETLRAVKLNVAGYLKKPFQIDALLELIGKHLAERAERRNRESETRNLRQSLFWSLSEQGRWAERFHPGIIQRPADLAKAIAHQLGFSGNLPEQIKLSVLLSQMTDREALSPPPFLRDAVKDYSILSATLEGESIPELVTFAREVCAKIEGEELPEADQLEGDWDPRILEAYNLVRSHTGTDEAEAKTASGLLNLGLTLEHAGDWDGALRAYKEVSEGDINSFDTLRAKLGEARVAAAQGNTKQLELTVKEVLDKGQSLGPVSLAQCQLEAALILEKSRHPAAKKLFGRASANLSKMGLPLSKARADLAIAALEGGAQEQDFDQILAVLQASENRLELMEHLPEVMTYLLSVLSQNPHPKGEQFCLNLIQQYPQELVAPLVSGLLGEKARETLLKLLESSRKSIPKPIQETLANDVVPDFRERALKLAGRKGESPNAAVLRVYTLGTLEVLLGSERLDPKELRTQKTRFLLARLLGSAPRALSVERLMEEFWPDAGSSARNNLNTSVSLMRRFLKTDDSELDPILRVGETLSVNPDLPFWHDADELEKAGATATRFLESDNFEAALPHLRRVAQLYRGPYLESCYMDWALERRTRYEILAAESLRTLVKHLAGQRRYAETIEYGLRLLHLAPDDVDGHDAVMQSYIGLDQPERAIDHFESYQQALSTEQMEPDISLFRTYQMAKYGIKADAGVEL